ncbi:MULTISPECIES: NRDE family protein [Desulfococcus]|jgi:uncharacterized protein with NRDE domain|uniref:NRDE family protein n=1 Tax=Desulfococcus multivorans DSM 2059 TaxID=1121405 RepID=S7TGU4_DESML|nr:NRDE family protein [Desulfococcus multivorans]AOY59814.1 conserved uncharacterized protein, DUF833 [Desulfococcus multivorans]AQV01981.1 hypothetical protein B2D07_15255 [Desulfococcus multivorans]EPR35815.1 protein of unknown function DUF833 [Desulfococcus multivorans DSM 2059]MDX9818333.1 NRDE family protein [Desulfococcus multivorans]SJZ33620.1 Uncharacterized conserved protein, contains NRDE domain [Desulfococcus multivorans DSM 2059]
MCLILFSYADHPDYRLILGANRDEFHERPTAPLGYWESGAAGPVSASVLAGRDLRGGGTWMGVTRAGRFAALTNFRDPSANRNGAPSRGVLVKDFLTGHEPPLPYLTRIMRNGASYNGFNLLVGDRRDLFCYSSRRGEIQVVTPGIHGLSNRFLDSPWPKVDRGKAAMAQVCSNGRITSEAVLRILEDRRRPSDDLLPETGVGLEWERILSSMFIVSPTYGTRSSSALLVGNGGEIRFVERTFIPDGDESRAVMTRRFRFTIDE